MINCIYSSPLDASPICWPSPLPCTQRSIAMSLHFPSCLPPVSSALCLSTASHKSAFSFSSWHNDRSPPPPKAKHSHCWRVQPRQFPLHCNCSQLRALISWHVWGRQGHPHRDSLSKQMGLQGFPQQEKFGSSHSCPNPAHVVPGRRDRLCVWFTVSVPRRITLMHFSTYSCLKKLTLLSLQASFYPRFYDPRW